MIATGPSVVELPARDNDIVVPKPCIPAGQYRLRYDGYETRILFSKPKVVMYFDVVEHADVRVVRYYRATKLLGKREMGGKFRIAKHSDMRREFCELFGVDISRLDRVPMSFYARHDLIGRVKVVQRDYKGGLICDICRYPVVEKLLRVECE